MTHARWWWCTAPVAGAVAVACVEGSPGELDRAAQVLTGRSAPAVGALSWRTLAGVDDGVLARPHAGVLLVMPHGGLRIRARLGSALDGVAVRQGEPAGAHALAHARSTYPEARDGFEALALATLAGAASPRAVDALLAQPAAWRAAMLAGAAPKGRTARDTVLNRLVQPARVVVTGAANAGKSTLMNALAGRAVAIAHDAPGTTRDAVAVRLDLDGVVVDWFDTPGVRANADAIEAHAAHLAAHLMGDAHLVVQITAPGLGWHMLHTPGDAAPPPVVRVLNKVDTPACAACTERAHAQYAVSALTGEGVRELVRAVRRLLVPDDALDDPAPWWFNAALPEAWAAGDSATLPPP